ncbi:hypothetical protein HYX13_00520 [Candidatus Woesearchaeota archaeon]|nr:hypothetical protein [Candidatus Woesearchaeota archaeon]
MSALIIGIFGMLCILTAFVLDEFVRRFNRDTVSYNALNFIGAGLLAYYGFTLRGWPFVGLNIVWCVVAGVKICGILSKIRKKRERK